MFNKQQTEFCKKEIEKAMSKFNGGIEDWLWTEMEESLKDEDILFNLFDNYYESSLIYLEVEITPDIRKKLNL